MITSAEAKIGSDPLITVLAGIVNGACRNYTQASPLLGPDVAIRVGWLGGYGRVAGSLDAS
jgi:hypothetical protein